MTAVIYTRVSSEEQLANNSLGQQGRDCRAYCEREGVPVEELFVERAESAKTMERPSLLKMIAYCERHRRSVTHVVVRDVSRLTRSQRDFLNLQALFEAMGITVRSATERFDDTATGNFIRNILAATAQFDNDAKAENTKARMKAAAERGEPQHRAPIGYVDARTRPPTYERDPERADLVTELFRRYSTGRYSLREACDYINAAGLRTLKSKKLSVQSARSLLRRRTYLGRVVVPKWGVDVKGNFEPLTDEETFTKVQAVLEERGYAKAPKRRANPAFPLTGLVLCGRCGVPLSGSSPNGRSRRYSYYQCRNSCAGVRCGQEALHGLFAELLRCLQPRPGYLRLFRAIVLDVWNERRSEAVRARRLLDDKIAGVRRRKDVLHDRYLEGKVHQADYEQQNARLAKDVALASIERDQLADEETDVEGLLDFGVHMLASAERMWMQFDPDQKRQFQGLLFPEGLPFDGSAFGTAKTSPVFSYLRSVSDTESKMASPRRFELRLPA